MVKITCIRKSGNLIVQYFVLVCMCRNFINKTVSIYIYILYIYIYLLPTGSENREVLGIWSISVVILPSCQDMKTIALY